MSGITKLTGNLCIANAEVVERRRARPGSHVGGGGWGGHKETWKSNRLCSRLG